MSNYKAITGSSKIVHRNQGGGSKLQGIPSTTNLNTWAHVAFRNRNVVCACNRNVIFCMNQLGGVGAGGIPGRSYAFAPGADGTHKPFYCGHEFGYHLGNNKHLIYPKKDSDGFTTIYKYPDSKINFAIVFNKYNDILSNTFTFFTSIKIQKGTTYKLKGSGIETAIFTVTEKNEQFSGSSMNLYNVTFTNQNINSGGSYENNGFKKYYITGGKVYFDKGGDPLFELSKKN